MARRTLTRPQHQFRVYSRLSPNDKPKTVAYTIIFTKVANKDVADMSKDYCFIIICPLGYTFI